MRTPLTPIPVEQLPGMVGRKIHLRGCRPGCVWRLEKIEGETLYLVTPKTGVRLTAHVKNALYTRGHARAAGRE